MPILQLRYPITLPCGCSGHVIAREDTGLNVNRTRYDAKNLVRIEVLGQECLPPLSDNHGLWDANWVEGMDAEINRRGLMEQGRSFFWGTLPRELVAAVFTLNRGLSQVDRVRGDTASRVEVDSGDTASRVETAPSIPKNSKASRKMTRKAKLPFLMGADPEFNIQVQGTRLHAQHVMAQSIGKRLGGGAMGWEVPGAGNIGYDGNAATAELRPLPSDKPTELTTRIGTLAGTLAKELNFVELKTTSEMATIGGHVHLDLPTGTSAPKVQAYGRCLASLYVPLLLGEDETNLRIRGKSTYGGLFDFKNQGGRLEFRAPSAEWITTPKVAEATLAFLGVCWHEITANPKGLGSLKDMMIKDSSDAKAVRDMAVRDYCQFLSGVTRRIKKAVRKFELYDQFKEEVELALAPKRMLAMKRKANFDMTVGWEFSPTSDPTKKQVMSDTDVNRLVSETDMERLKHLVSVPYNDDRNVGLYAEELTRRIVGFGWKLKNSYYLFGTKKGVGTVAADANMKIFAGATLLCTTEDWGHLSGTFRSMHAAMQSLNRTGVPPERRIAIGISYEERERRSIRGLMGVISDIERGRIVPVKATDLKLKQPIGDDRGKIAACYAAKATQTAT